MKLVAFRSAVLASCAMFGTSAAFAQSGGLYIGAFGGIGSSGGQSIAQNGTAHKGFSGEGEYEGNYYTYDLPVAQSGHSTHESSTVFGGQIGYEWGNGSGLAPAIEVEGLYLTADQNADLENEDDEIPTKIAVIHDGVKTTVTDRAELSMVQHHGELAEGPHTFNNTANMKVAMFMLNGVMSYHATSKLTPYVGVGFGMALVNMKDAVSLQTGPGGVEKTGGRDDVNHFNSKDSAKDSVFAAQAKAGLRFQISGKTSLFAEYRYVNLASTDYTFGATIYPDHAPTDAWIVEHGSMHLHNGLVGIRFGF